MLSNTHHNWNMHLVLSKRQKGHIVTISHTKLHIKQYIEYKRLLGVCFSVIVVAAIVVLLSVGGGDDDLAGTLVGQE